MTSPKIAIGPGHATRWVIEAVKAGGGEVVDAGAAAGLVWSDPRDVERLERTLLEAPQIRWVQLPWAGVEEFARAGLFRDGRTWTCGKGVYAEPVAEHALALGLAGLRDLPERARANSWGRPSGTSLYGGRVTIVGGGGITQSLIGLLGPLRCDVTVVRRRAARLPGAARVVAAEKLHDALEGADLVVLALALTPETVGIIGRAELDHMEAHAWLVNVARGPHVVTDDLVGALQAGVIGGAALDVTDPEPLPDSHPLWALPNCLITPHTGNTIEMAIPPLTARIRENVARFASGEDLLGGIDPELGY